MDAISILKFLALLFGTVVATITAMYKLIIIPINDKIDKRLELLHNSNNDLHADNKALRDKISAYSNEMEFTKGKLESISDVKTRYDNINTEVMVTKNRVDNLEIMMSKMSDKIDVVLTKFDAVGESIKTISEKVVSIDTKGGNCK